MSIDDEFCFLSEGEPSSTVSPASDCGVNQQQDALLNALRLQRDAYPHLSDNQFNCLQALLFEYSDIFAVDDTVLGCVPDE
jgi:hypothetical protein